MGAGSGSDGSAGLLAAGDSVLAGLEDFGDTGFAVSADSDSVFFSVGVGTAASVDGALEAGAVVGAAGAGAGSALGFGCGAVTAAGVAGAGVGVCAVRPFICVHAKTPTAARMTTAAIPMKIFLLPPLDSD